MGRTCQDLTTPGGAPWFRCRLEICFNKDCSIITASIASAYSFINILHTDTFDKDCPETTGGVVGRTDRMFGHTTGVQRLTFTPTSQQGEEIHSEGFKLMPWTRLCVFSNVCQAENYQNEGTWATGV